MKGCVVFSTPHELEWRDFAAAAPEVVEKPGPRLWHSNCLTSGRMGFSFSGLSLVPTAAAEVGAGDVVQHGVAAGRQSSKPFLSARQPTRDEKDGSTHSEVGWPGTAVCAACADARPTQPHDVPSQAALFSSLWTSALETSEPENSDAGHRSLSILTAGELLSARLASQEHPLAVLADADAVAAAAAEALGAGLQAGIGVREYGAGLEHLPLMPDTKLLMQSFAVASPAVGSEAVEAAAANAANNAALSADDMAAEVEGIAEALADHQGRGFTDAAGSREQPLAWPGDAASRPAESRASGVAADDAKNRRPLPDGSKVSRPENAGARDEESGAPTQQVPANGIANPFTIGTERTAPNAPAAGAAARPFAPQTNSLPPLPQGVSPEADADASATQATPGTPQAEIAFQAELQLNNSQDGPSTPVSHSQRDALARWTASLPHEDVSANSAANHAQQPKPKAAAENAETIETVRTIAFRSAGDHPDTGGASLGQGHTGGSLDRGTQQTTPLSHGPFLMNAQPSPDSAPSSRMPAAPAAARLDAAAPDAPTETGPAARSVALKIQSEQHGAANVVLTDRGGQVHVTVRSGDPALTNALRSDLGSLAGGLQQHGFDVKFWNRPSGSAMDGETRGNANEFSGQDDVRGHERHRHSPEDSGRRQRRGEWIEEFD
jgi:hypothetical protein